MIELDLIDLPASSILLAAIQRTNLGSFTHPISIKLDDIYRMLNPKP